MNRLRTYNTNFNTTGWVETDPFAYDYSGPDPDNEIVPFLDDVDAGRVEFMNSTENPREDIEGDDQLPALKLLSIGHHIQVMNGIAFVLYHDDFTSPHGRP